MDYKVRAFVCDADNIIVNIGFAAGTLRNVSARLIAGILQSGAK